ncbi:MAG: galactitol-1-phosphate 5-dehydrogenase [Lachnospiraceae bacterium]|nr:galactitol-1-phosphate 5-dehydrogenase [Lachnospiraceae bacterium]
MKAWVLHSVNDIRFEEPSLPVPKDDEVLIRVRAAGVCGSDIPRIFKNGAHKMPLIPGHEFSGVVEATGLKADSSLKGRKVGIYPLIPCGKCVPCREGHPETCRDYDYVGSRRDGAFSEFVAVPARNVRVLPDNISFEEAAMLEPMAVSVHALRLALGLSADEDSRGKSFFNTDKRIVVCGLGTIGLLLTMFLLERGLKRIYVIGNKEKQREMAVSLGIAEENFLDSGAGDVSLELRKKAGEADIFFECVGKNECVSYGIENTAANGRVLLLGNPYSDMGLSRDTYWKILRNQLLVRGSWNSTFLPGDSEDTEDDWDYVIKRLKEKKIRPAELITHRLSIADLYRGFSIMHEKSEYFCKVMMTNPG